MTSKTDKATSKIITETKGFNPGKLRNTERVPVFEYDGIRWPTFPPFRAKGIENAVKDIMTLPARDTDVLICSYMKSVTYGSWYEYELGMEQAEKEYPEIIYTCYFEAMKKDPEKEIKKLADFLKVKCSDKTIKSIAMVTTFENMQKNKADPTSFFDEEGKGFLYRKGEIGDWKNHFSVAQNEKFDSQFLEKMKDSQYKFTFD